MSSMEEETERMRAELLMKEKELLELKKREMDALLQNYKTKQEGKDNLVRLRDGEDFFYLLI